MEALGNVDLSVWVGIHVVVVSQSVADILEHDLLVVGVEIKIVFTSMHAAGSVGALLSDAPQKPQGQVAGTRNKTDQSIVVSRQLSRLVLSRGQDPECFARLQDDLVELVRHLSWISRTVSRS